MELGLKSGWAAKILAGINALSRGAPCEAVAHGLASFAHLEPERPGDPRRAATHANLGIGYVLLEDWAKAESAFRAAEQHWLDAIETLATLDFPIVGRSSSFHFSLASRNVPAFQDTRRRRYENLCHACLAITRFNRMFAERPAPKRETVETSARKLTAVLSGVFGPRAPDVRALTCVFANAADDNANGVSPYAEKSAEFESRMEAMSALLPEACQNLEAATALTAVIALDAELHPLLHVPASTSSYASKSLKLSTSSHGLSVPHNE
jgi:hypothetical protein